jgi:hypothetical protein
MRITLGRPHDLNLNPMMLLNIRIIIYLLLLILAGGSNMAMAGVDNRSCTSFASSWKRLTFDGSGTLAKVSTKIQLKRSVEVHSDLFTKMDGEVSDCTEMGDNIKYLSVETTVRYMLFFSERYTESILFNAENGRACRRIRQRNGKDPWIKAYFWTRRGVQRRKVRPASPNEKTQLPAKWTQRSQTFYPYPIKSGCLVITDSVSLIYMLSVLDYSRLQLPFELCVFGKKQFHRLTIDAQPSFPIKASFKTHSASGDDSVEDRLKPLVFTVSAEPAVPTSIESEKFSLLGLQKDICIYIDQARRLPIRVSGVNAKLGNLVLNLSDAELK